MVKATTEMAHEIAEIPAAAAPALTMAAGDAKQIARSLRQMPPGFVVSGAREATALPHIRTGHWLTDRLVLLASFYAMVERVVALRGINPDRPRHLNKVTEII